MIPKNPRDGETYYDMNTQSIKMWDNRSQQWWHVTSMAPEAYFGYEKGDIALAWEKDLVEIIDLYVIDVWSGYIVKFIKTGEQARIDPIYLKKMNAIDIARWKVENE